MKNFYPFQLRVRSTNNRPLLIKIGLSVVSIFMVNLALLGQIEINLEPTAPSCGEFTDGKINTTVSGGQQPYDIAWNTGSSDLSLFGIGYGTYSLTITDANGLSAADTVEITGPDPVTPVFTFLSEPCDGPTVDYQVSGGGGVGPYTFLWEDGSTDSIRTAVDEGVYCVTVTDALGCAGADCIIVPFPFQITVTAIPPLCPAGCDGAAVVEIFGGQTPYDILWSNGATTSINANLLPGTYSVTVTDANGCQRTGSANVPDGEGELAITNIETTNPTCREGGRIAITAVATNGPITYLWSDGSMDPVIEDIPAGTYGVTITDRNGCHVSESITLIDENDLSVIVEVAYECGDPSGSATATGQGGVPPYTYNWNNGQSGPTATNLTPGELYKVSVTDDTGCEVGKTVIIADIDEFEVLIDGAGPACNGFTNGFANAIVPGLDTLGELTYLWSTGQIAEGITNLRPGTYSVTVSDQNGCGGAASITIEEPETLQVDVEVTNVFCGEENTGTAQAIVTGGTPPYTYEWTNNGGESMATGLGVGFHSVLVTDANGCELFKVIEIVEVNDIEVAISKIDATCDESNGAITAAVTGGTAPYQFEWSTGQSGPELSDLSPGTYTVTITDNSGCSQIERVNIVQSSGLTVAVEANQIICHDERNGSAVAEASGGRSPYEYSWDTGDRSAAVENLSAGTYTVTATDADGCVAVTEVVIVEPSMIIAEISKVDIGCDGEPGSASVMGFGGTGSFSYQWSTGDTGTEISGLEPGTYSVLITDLNGCNIEESITIEGASSLVAVEISVIATPTAGENDGILSANPSGGTAPYTFAWNNGEVTDTIAGLMPGTYEVTVTDARGCVAIDVISLASNEICINVDDPGVIGYDQVICGPGATAEPFVSIELATGGNGPIEYLWMYSTIPGPFDATSWIPIPDSNSPTYDPGKVYETTYYARCARVENCPNFLETNILVIEVGSDAVAEIASPTVPICVGDTVTFVATDNGEGAVYSWDFGPGAKPRTSNAISQKVVYSANGLRTVVLTVEKNGCISEDRQYVTATDTELYCGDGLVINAEPENNNTNVTVTWVVDHSNDGLDFILRRSKNLNEGFKNIGESIKPVDSTATSYQYRFVDKEPIKGQSYYQVEVQDQFGNIIPSNIANVAILDPTLGDIYAYPNPFKSTFVIERVDLYDDEAIQIDIRSATGQHMMLDGMEANEFEKSYNMAFWPSGVYYIRVIRPNEEHSIRTFRLTKVNH